MIGEALQRSAAAFNAAGTDLNKSIALVTTANAVVQDPASVGTMFKTLSARLRGSKIELAELGEEEDQFTKSTSKLRETVKAMTGFDIMENDNQYKDLMEILVGIGKEFKNLEDVERAGLLEALGGKRATNALAAVLNNYEMIEKAYATAEGAEGSAMREQANYAQSVQYSIDRAKASLQQLANDFLNSDFLKGAIEAANEFLKVLDNIINTFGSLPPLLTLVGGINFGLGKLSGKGSLMTSLVDSLKSTLKKAFTKTTVSEVAGNAFSDGFAEAAKKGLDSVQLDDLPSKQMVNAGENVGSKFLSGIAHALGPVGIAGVVAVGIAGAWKAYQVHQEKLLEKARRKTEEDIKKFEGAVEKIDEYKERYSSLYDQMTDPANTDEETLGYKKQIYELQNEIVGKYGEQVAGINLVNGELRTQIGLLEQAKGNMASAELNANEKTYENSEKEMTKERRFKVGFTEENIDVTKPGKAVSEIIKELESYGFKSQYEEGYGFTLYLDANLLNASEALDKFDEKIANLRKRGPEYVQFIDTAITGFLSDAIDEAESGAADYSETFWFGLKQNANKDSKGLLTEYTSLTNAYNEALATGSDDVIQSTYEALSESREKVEKFLGKEGNEKYQIAFDLVQVDESVKKAYDLKNAIASVVDTSKPLSKDNQFGDPKDLKAMEKGLAQLQKKEMDEFDLRQAMTRAIDKRELSRSGVPTGLNTDMDTFLLQLADSYGIAETSGASFEAGIASIISLLSTFGIDIKTAGESVSNNFAVSLDDITTAANQAMASIDNVNAALVNSVSGKGMSFQWDAENGFSGDVQNIMDAFSGDEFKGLYNPATLFRRTANGIKINTKELNKLQKKQEQITKAKFYEKQKELTEALAAAEKERADGLKTAPNDQEIQNLKNQLEEVNLLASAYDGATSAYQNWLDAQSAGEEGAMYDNIQSTALSRGDELLEKGLVGTEEFRALAELVSGKDLTTAGIEDVIAAWEGVDSQIGNTGHTIRDFFKEGTDGTDAFADAMVKLNYATEKDGFVNFELIDTEELARSMNTSVDIVESILHKMKDYGAELSWVSHDQMLELRDQLPEIQKAVTSVSESAEKSGITIPFDIDIENQNSVTELDGTIENIQRLLAEGGRFNIDPTLATELNNLLQECVEKKNILQGYDTSMGVTSQAIEAGEQALSDLNSRMELYSNRGLEINLKDKQLVEDATLIQDLPTELKISLGFEANDKVEDILSKLAGEHSVTIAAEKPPGMPTSDWEKINAEPEQPTSVIEDVGESLKSGASEAADQIKESATQLGENVSQAGFEFVNNVTTAANTVAKAFDGGVESLKSVQNGMENGLRNFLQLSQEENSTKESGEEWFNGIQESATQLGTDIVQGATDFVGKAQDAITTQITSNIEGISEKFTTAKEGIQDGVTGFIDDVKEAIWTSLMTKRLNEEPPVSESDFGNGNKDLVVDAPTGKSIAESIAESIHEAFKANPPTDEELSSRLGHEPQVYESDFGNGNLNISLDAEVETSGIEGEVENAVDAAQESAPPVEVSAELDTEELDENIATWVINEKPVIKPLIQMPETPVSGALTTIEQSVHTTVDTSGVDALSSDVSSIDDKDITLGVDTTEGQSNVDTLKESIDEVTEPKEGSIELKTKGQPELDDMNSGRSTFASFGNQQSTASTVTSGLEALMQSVSYNRTFRTMKDHVVTNTTKVVTVTENRTSPVNGTAHIGGTALSHFYGSAHQGGDWRTKKDEVALMAELGPEIMVNGRTGQWELIGENGAQFQQVPAGSIIFNHKQTEDLLEHGYTLGRAHLNGTANLGGTAYAGVSGSYKVSGYKKKKDSGSGSGSGNNGGGGNNGGNNNGNNNNTKNNNKAKKDRSLVDWIEVLIDNLQKELEHFKTLGEYYTKYTKQNVELENAIKYAKELIDKEGAAEKRYIKQVEKGFLNYTYQDDKGNTKRLFDSKKGKKDGTYRRSVYNDYLEKIKEGKIDIESIKDANLASAISEAQGFKNKADEAKAAVLEMKQEIIELNKQKLDNIIDDFDKIVNLNQSNADISESIIKLYDKLGMSRDDIVKQYQNEGSFINKNIIEREKELIAYRDEITKQLNGNLKDPERRREAETELNKINKELLDTRVRIYEINESIRELNWKNFNIGTEILSHMESQLNSTLDLLSDFTTFNKNSSALTDMGFAQVNLNAQLMGEARKQIKHYQEAIKAVTAELEDKRITEEQANKEIREYQENILSAANSLKKYKNAIISYIKDGINKETEAMSELISKRKEALQKQKDADDYAKSIRDKTKNINKLQLQIASMSGDTTDATRAKVKQLNAQLKEAQEDLDETRKQHSYDTLVQGLDDENEAFKKRQDERVEALEASLAEQDKAIEALLFSTAQKFDTTAQQLKDTMDSYGIILEDFIVEPWNNAETAMTTFVTASTSLDNVKTKIKEIREELEKQATINVNKEQIDALDSQIESLKAKIAALSQTDNQINIPVNNGQIDILDGRINAIKAQIAELSGEHAEGQQGKSINIPVNVGQINMLQAELAELERQKASLSGQSTNGQEGEKLSIPVDNKQIKSLAAKLDALEAQRAALSGEKDTSKSLSIPVDFTEVDNLLTKLGEAQKTINDIKTKGFVDEVGSGNDGSNVAGSGAGSGSSSGGGGGGNTGGSTTKSNATPITTVKTESFSSNGSKQATVLVPISQTLTNGKTVTVIAPSTSAGGGIQSVTSTEKGISVTRKGTGGKVTSVAKNKKLKTQNTGTYKFRKEPKKEAAYATGDGITKGTIPNGKDVTTTGKVSYQGDNLWLQVKYNKTTGWIRYDGLKKAQVGTKAAQRGLYLTDEEGVGSEAIITKKGVLRQLDAGDMVFNASQREALWNLSKMDVGKLRGMVGKSNVFNSVTNNYGSLLTVNGNVDKEALPKLQEILKQACEYTKKDIFMTQKKMGFA